MDGHFAADMDYLFTSQYLCEAKQVRDSAQIMLCQSRFAYQTSQVNAQILSNPERLNQLIMSDTTYKFLKTVCDSPSYWQAALHDAMAMTRQLGTPTCFLTLSPAQFQWADML
jgi:hypothetical protein